jgi:hypothetical protein
MKDIVAPFEVSSGEAVSVTIERVLEERRIFSVDTIEAILNPEYFIDRIEASVEIRR